MLRFIVPPNQPSIQREQLLHRDLLTLDGIDGDGPATCAVRLLAGLRRLVTEEGAIDFVMVTDDDVWLSPVRLMHDLRELLDHPRHILYGPVAFAGGWNAARLSHYGWSPFSDVENRMPGRSFFRRGLVLAETRPGAIGPFPFLMGYCGMLSGELARELAISDTASTLVARLLATAARRRPDPGLPRGKCYPGGDVAIGYVIAELNRRRALSRRLLVLDTTYAQRVLPFANHYASAVVELHKRAAVLHNATRWREDFRWALCTSTGGGRDSMHGMLDGMRAEGKATKAAKAGVGGRGAAGMRPAGSSITQRGELAVTTNDRRGSLLMAVRRSRSSKASPSHLRVGESRRLGDIHARRSPHATAATADATTTTVATTAAATAAAAALPARPARRRLRREVAPVMRCRGPDAPSVRCGLMRCTSHHMDALHNGSTCSKDARCSQYYRTTFENWTFCIAVASRTVRRATLGGARGHAAAYGAVHLHGGGSTVPTSGARWPPGVQTGAQSDADWDVCSLSADDVLASCDRGFPT